MTQIKRPNFHRFHNGSKAALPFCDAEYETRLAGLRNILRDKGVNAAVFTSMHNIAYYSGFLYCAFGRPYGLVVTATDCVTISAGIDAGQPWRRSFADNITYTDWQRDNYWRAIASVAGQGGVIGYEGDHLSLTQAAALNSFLAPEAQVDLAQATMQQRMMKSPAEIALIRAGAATADVGGYAIRDAVRAGVREIDVAMAGRDAMEAHIAREFPDAEYRDTWVWFQSGLNTDGAHNPVTSRVLQRGDILSLNTFPMISGYYTALERTMFVETVDASIKVLLGGQCRRPRTWHQLAETRRQLCGGHGRCERLLRRPRFAAISLIRLWPFLWRVKPLLRSRSRARTARGHRHDSRARHGHFHGTHDHNSRWATWSRRVS